MNNEREILETIDQYLGGNMSEEERINFENAMAIDSKLASQVAEIKHTEEAVLLANLSILKGDIGKNLKEIEYKPASKIKKGHIITSTLLLIGVSVVGISLLSNDEKASPSHEAPAKTVSDSVINEKVAPATPEATHESHETETMLHTPEKPLNNNSDNSLSPVTDTTHSNNEVRTTEPNKKTIDSSLTTIKSEIKNNPDTSSSIKPRTETSEVKCDKVFDISATASCPNKATGTISVISDDNLYNVELDNSRTNHSNGMLYDIPAGKHLVTIKYADECIYKESLIIEKKWCPLNTSYSFNPDYGEKWEIKYQDGDHGVFMIYNGLGKELYKSKFGDGGEYWDGTDADGKLLPTDTYQAIIKYTDGRFEKVILTIAR